MEKRALITGITGQDGSYLAECLLDKGYEVFGLVRRLSRPNLENLSEIRDRIELMDGDVLDQSSLNRVVNAALPTEVYHLAAQSYVATSFSQPVLTGEVTALGALRMFEAVRTHAPAARVYQASSSEMFGSTEVEPQNETTQFHPRSPYALAKVFAYWAAVGYREAYSMYVSNGILYNHECFTPETPVIVRNRNGLVDCLPIEETLPDPNHGTRQSEPSFQVWDRGGFVDAVLGTATWNGADRPGKIQRVVDGRSSLQTTLDHLFLRGDGRPVAACEVDGSKSLLHCALPQPSEIQTVSLGFARFAGRLASAGNFCEGGSTISFLNPSIFDSVQEFWEGRSRGAVHETELNVQGRSMPGLRLEGERDLVLELGRQCLTRRGAPRVPRAILNSARRVWSDYLAGLHEAAQVPAGGPKPVRIDFGPGQSCLEAGVDWMQSALRQDGPAVLPRPDRDRELPKSANFTGAERPSVQEDRGSGLTVGASSPAPSTSTEPYVGWVYDLATASGTLHAGVGDLVVHNSPRRGVEFVTRRISLGVARIKAGLQSELRLGNLDAQRDWGYAPEYVDLMWRILQQPEPGDFVGATGETHSVREFLAAAFEASGLDSWERRVVLDPRQTRPADVIRLRGDPAKAKRVLGWEAKTRFPELVRIMVKADFERLAPPAEARTG